MKEMLAARNYVIAQWKVYDHLNRKADRANGLEEMDTLDPIE